MATKQTKATRWGILFLAFFTPWGFRQAQARSTCPEDATENRTSPHVVHAMTDIAHEFTFYFDGRFAKNYIQPRGGKEARNWGTLHKCDLDRINLLILPAGATPCPYLAKDIAAVRRFLAQGGGVLVLGDFDLFHDEKTYRLNELVQPFGAAFVEQKAKEPLVPQGELAGQKIHTYGGRTITLKAPKRWEILIRDSEKRIVLAKRRIEKGWLVIASRALCGHRPDATDPVNAEWWQPLLENLAQNKPIDPSRSPRSFMPENHIEKDGLRIECSDYLKPMAEEIFDIYKRCKPALERILGVPPTEGMLATLILLPTGGGGFSSGRAIGLGIWWGDFPRRQAGMVELLGHEATHSWVLPFPEPMWNEGIATYVGILLTRALGFEKEADATLKQWIDSAARLDPDMKKYCLRNEKNVPHAIRMAKPMWIWEELRKEKPDLLQRYFRAKRKLIDPQKVSKYTEDDCVAVLSLAMGRDLFPWFRSLGVEVDRARTSIEPGAEPKATTTSQSE